MNLKFLLFKKFLIKRNKENYLKINIHPDGGVSRIRAFGTFVIFAELLQKLYRNFATIAKLLQNFATFEDILQNFGGTFETIGISEI